MNLEGGKPFQLFLYKWNGDILKVEFPYIYLENDTKKALSLYPNIILKCVDIGAQYEKTNFQLFVGKNQMIKQEQI